jgi:hypothetical protein
VPRRIRCGCYGLIRGAAIVTHLTLVLFLLEALTLAGRRWRWAARIEQAWTRLWFP